tara:strand:- start:5110 stop:5334 length:225 start_codon:yes stop_codon:yes gene_type:complete
MEDLNNKQLNNNNKENNMVSNINIEEDKLINLYISQLNDTELIIYNIAKQHLETSFDISKSIGFIEWKKIHLEK